MEKEWMKKDFPDEFEIDLDTAVLFSKFDEYGYEKTEVYQKDEILTFDMSPKKMLEDCFYSIGYSMKGAIEGAQRLLERKRMVPFVYMLHRNIIFIPSFTSDKMGKVFIAQDHIKDMKPFGKDATTVFFNNGRSITVGERYRKLKDRNSSATTLLVTMRKRWKLDPYQTFSIPKLYSLAAESTQTYTT